MTDPLERLTNLLALLLETRVPLTVDDIAFELAGQYPDTPVGRHAAFERDKAQLRAAGIPISTEVLAGDQAGKTGYRIERDQFELGDLGLADDERAALQMAVAAVRLGAGWAGPALIKLGGRADDDGGPLSALLPTLDHLPTLFDAVSRRCVTTFEYHGRTRDLEPWGLLARGGFWYLVGRDQGSGEQRTFRVDRITGGVKLGREDSFDRPADFDARSAFPADAKLLGEPEGATEALVLVDADRARAVALELGESAVVERRDGGAAVVRVPCVNRPVFRSWLLGFVDHAVVLEPSDVRAEIVEWLRAMVTDG